MLNDREKILTALREKPLKIYEVMKRANLPNEEACQSLLMKMRDEGVGQVRHSQGTMADRLTMIAATARGARTPAIGADDYSCGHPTRE